MSRMGCMAFFFLFTLVLLFAASGVGVALGFPPIPTKMVVFYSCVYGLAGLFEGD